MAWGARLKSIKDDASQFDSITVEISYYNKIGHESFSDFLPFTLEDSFETIRAVVLKKLSVINFFRAKVDELKLLIGKEIREIPVEKPRAAGLGLKADLPVQK
jgi:hypothetical protein